MDGSLPAVLTAGFLLGIKHAIEPDHMIAVSTIASQTKNLRRSTLAGMFWGIGHTATLWVAGMILLAVKGKIPAEWTMSMEFVVGVMLVYLGITSFHTFRLRRMHAHPHGHGGTVHTHLHAHPQHQGHDHAHARLSYAKSFAVGFVHGLAGSAAMAALTMSLVSSWWEGVLYILIFGAGTVAGMLFFTTLLGIPFVFSVKRLPIHSALTRITGAVSALYGVYYMVASLG